MKRSGFIAMVTFAAAGAMTMAAQETRTPGGATTAEQGRPNQQAPATPNQETPATTTPSSQPANGTMTLTGCIQSSGDAAAAGSMRTYTLMANNGGAAARTNSGAPGTGARTEGAAGQGQSTRPGQSTAGSAPTAGSASVGTGMTTYTLEGAEVAKHVGHQVEVMGTIAPSAGAARTGERTGDRTADRTAGSDRPAVGTAGSTGDRRIAGAQPVQTFRVSSIKMLSATCSR